MFTLNVEGRFFLRTNHEPTTLSIQEKQRYALRIGDQDSKNPYQLPGEDLIW